MRRFATFDQGGYELADGEALNRDYPESFYMPPRAEREALKKGDIAKLIFDILIDGDVNNAAAERMWVEIVDCQNGIYAGRLDNKPACRDEGKIRLAFGDNLFFGPEHIIQSYTVAELEAAKADRARILETVTREQAIIVQKAMPGPPDAYSDVRLGPTGS